jgi:hypothetical protein
LSLEKEVTPVVYILHLNFSFIAGFANLKPLIKKKRLQMSKVVRYAIEGLNVRSTAAGTVVRAIDKGALMIYDNIATPIPKALNGTTYT